MKKIVRHWTYNFWLWNFSVRKLKPLQWNYFSPRTQQSVSLTPGKDSKRKIYWHNCPNASELRCKTEIMWSFTGNINLRYNSKGIQTLKEADCLPGIRLMLTLLWLTSDDIIVVVAVVVAEFVAVTRWKAELEAAELRSLVVAGAGGRPEICFN